MTGMQVILDSANDIEVGSELTLKVDPLGLTQPTISRHLKVLVDAGIFNRDQRGKWAYYALVPRALDALSAVLSTTA